MVLSRSKRTVQLTLAADGGREAFTGVRLGELRPPRLKATLSGQEMMTHFTLETLVDAQPEVCFDLSRDIDLHTRSMAHTGERAVAGRTTGRIGLGEEVTWEGRHFGIRQRLTSRITKFDRPRSFQDTMVRGAFSSFKHDHYFEPDGRGTRMTDSVVFSAPGGPLGLLAERLVLRSYLKRLLRSRNQVIKAAAEKSPVVAAR